MTGVPPFSAPSFHLIAIVVPLEYVTSLAKLKGASGIVKIGDPELASEYTEVPLILVAATLA